MKIPFKHIDVQEQALKTYPENVWMRSAFRVGVLWAVEQIFKDKIRDDIFNEMEIPRISMD